MADDDDEDDEAANDIADETEPSAVEAVEEVDDSADEEEDPGFDEGIDLDSDIEVDEEDVVAAIEEGKLLLLEDVWFGTSCMDELLDIEGIVSGTVWFEVTLVFNDKVELLHILALPRFPNVCNGDCLLSSVVLVTRSGSHWFVLFPCCSPVNLVRE